MDMTSISRLGKSLKSGAKKHTPEILTGLGIAGMITTTVMAVKATPKALKLIEAAEREKYNESHDTDKFSTGKEPLTTVETVKVAWKPYVPAMVTGAASIGCLVGASSVHGVCGIFGTLMTGLFAVDGGAFYGGGFGFFGAQVFGILCIDLWAAATGVILFYSIKKICGLRVDKRIEEEGLDIYEHGESCYN